MLPGTVRPPGLNGIPSPPPSPPPYKGEELADPPAYDAGYCVDAIPASAENRLQPILTIKLDNDDPSYIYSSGDLLSGKVVATPSTRDIPFEKILVDLQLSEVVQGIRNHQYVVGTHAVSVEKYLIPSSVYPEDLILRKGYQYSFTFSMIIPDTLPAGACAGHDDPRTGHYDMPPSVGVPTEAEERDVWNCDGKSFSLKGKGLTVSYRIRARLTTPGDELGTRQLISRHHRHIRFLPRYDHPTMAHNQVQHTATLKKLFSRRPSVDIKLSVPKVPTLFLYRPIFWLRLDLDVPDTLYKIESVSLQLIAHTTICLGGLNREWTGSKPQTIDTEFPPHKVTFSPPTWTPSSFNRITTSVWVAMVVPLDTKVIPSFESCFASHTYDLVASVDFGGHVARITLPTVVSHSREEGPVTVPTQNCIPLKDKA